MSNTTQQTPTAKAPRVPLNGVDVPTLFATLDAVKAQPELAHFRFRGSNDWISGTHSRGRADDFDGAGAHHEHKREYVFDADHPVVLTGTDEGPAPVEFLLQGLMACITAGIGNIASARGIRLHRVRSRIEGDIDLNGILGLSSAVRNGFEAIRVHFDIEGDAPPEKLKEIVEQSRARSAVYDVLTNGVPVELSVDAA